MGRYGGNWTWYEYRAIQTMDPFVQRDPSFGRDVQSTPPQGCPLLVLCHLIPIHLYSSSCNWCSCSEQLHQRRKQNFSLKHRTSRVVLFNEINDETGCKLTEACRMENGTVMVTTCDIIKGIMTLLYHHGIDFHKWSVHICIISLHVMYQLISVAYILNIYIYTHISIKALSILSPRSSCHSPTGTLSAFFEPPRWTTLAQRNRHTGRKSVAKAQFPKRDAKKPCQDWPKRVNTKSGKTMQWYWHVGWQKQESDWVSTWIVFVCIAASPKGRISGAHSHFSGCLLKKPTTCKVHEQLARTCGTFPQLQLAVVPFLLMIMIFLIGVVACCGNLLIHTGSNYPCKIKCMDLRNESTRIRCGKRQHIVSDIKYKLVPLISSVHPSFTSATSITLSSSCMNFMDFAKF